jgi:hypothetical protein
MFGPTSAIVQGLIDSFAKTGATCRLNEDDSCTRLDAIIPLRGDDVAVSLDVAMMAQHVQHHCVLAELSDRVGSDTSRFELREFLQRAADWIKSARGLRSVSESSAFGVADTTPHLPEPDDGKLFHYAPPGRGGDPPSKPTQASATAALLADMSSTDLSALFAGTPPRPTAASAVLDLFSRSSYSPSALSRLAAHVVSHIHTDVSPSSGSDTLPPDGTRGRVVKETCTHSPAPLPRQLSHPLDAAPLPSPEEAEDALLEALPPTPPAPQPAAASTWLSLPPPSGLFAESSEHIRKCVSGTHSEAATPVTAQSLEPLARMAAQTGIPSRLAIAAATRLLHSSDDKHAVRAAMREAGLFEGILTTLLRVAERQAEMDAAAGSTAVRDPSKSLQLVRKAASDCHLTVSDLSTIVRGCSTLGVHHNDVDQVNDKRPGAATALKGVLQRWSLLPDSSDAALVQLQRVAVHAADDLEDPTHHHNV